MSPAYAEAQTVDTPLQSTSTSFDIATLVPSHHPKPDGALVPEAIGMVAAGHAEHWCQLLGCMGSICM